MSYDLHITRAESCWTESHLTPIPEGEWIAHVRSDSEFRFTSDPPAFEFEDKSGKIHRSITAVWVGYSLHNEEFFDEQMAFVYRGGKITVQRPDDEVVEKMKGVAGALKARVVGDENEVFE